MKKDYTTGNVLYGFFIVVLLCLTFGVGLSTARFTREHIIMAVSYTIAQTLILRVLKRLKVINDAIYTRALLAFAAIAAYAVAFTFSNLHIFVFVMLIHSMAVLLYFDAGLCYYQTALSIIVLLLGNYQGVTLEVGMTHLEVVFCAGALLLAMWIAKTILDTIAFTRRQTEEQAQSLDDLTRVVEAKCEQAQIATRSKSDFLASMSHEIRTPINAILGMNEMILRESSDEAILQYAENVNSSGKLLLALINDVLDFSKIESGKMELVPTMYQLSSVLNDLLNMLEPRAREKQLEIVAKVDPTIPNVLYGDEVRIRQVVTNILTNAVKYTDKGTITLHVTCQVTQGQRRSVVSDDLKGVEVIATGVPEGSRPSKINLIVAVTDTGKGIKKEDMPKLFASFSRVDQVKNRHVEGTGLGLAITQSFVELMQGEIKVDSTYGEGSTFTIRIPQIVKKQEPIGDFEETYAKTAKERETYAESFHAPNARILVVDDTKMNLKVVTHLLKQTKVQVDTATGGLECLDILRKHETGYHMILLDHMMPDLDGISCLKQMQEEGLAKDVPVIALTANAVSGARATYLDAGFSDYISKPIMPEELEALMRKWLPKDIVETGKA